VRLQIRERLDAVAVVEPIPSRRRRDWVLAALLALTALPLTELVLPWLVVAAFALAMRYRARAIEGRNDQVRLAERNSLARELHDSVAHHVSAIAVQAQAGQFVIDSDPVAAAKALQAIEAIANESIDEMPMSR